MPTPPALFEEQSGPLRQMDHPADEWAGTRNKLTDYWADHEIKPGAEFAILTDIIHEADRRNPFGDRHA